MCLNLKNYYAFFALIFYNTFINVTNHRIEDNFDFKKLENRSPFPGVFTHHLNLTDPSSPVLQLGVANITEDLNVTALAIPWIKNESNCPKTAKGNDNLRQYAWFNNFKGADKGKQNISIFYIFTGCYYIMMTNSADSYWQFGPIFANTSYRYYDTALQLKSNATIKPEISDSSMELQNKIKIPLSCLKIKAVIYEWNSTIKVDQHQIDRRTPISQKCWITKNDRPGPQSCAVSNNITNVSLHIMQVEEGKDDQWTVALSWKGLQRGGGTYHVEYTPDTLGCVLIHHYNPVCIWKPFVQDIRIYFGPINESDYQKGEPQTPDILHDEHYRSIFFIILASMMTAILAYWILKYKKLCRKGISRSDSENLRIMNDSYKIKSDSILLIYVAGCPTFMRVIETLIEDLKKVGHVHDVYSDENWSDVMSRTPTDWITRLLSKGCRVVWVDTPQLRSQWREPYIRNDPRDVAAQHAIDLVKQIFYDSTTQYIHHFVVRVEGFEVQDTSDDPLLLISPSTRYRYPDHLECLCNDMKDPMYEYSEA